MSVKVRPDKYIALAGTVFLFWLMTLFLNNALSEDLVSTQRIQGLLLGTGLLVVFFVIIKEGISDILMSSVFLALSIFFPMIIWTKAKYGVEFLFTRAFLWMLVMWIGYAATKCYKCDKLVSSIALVAVIVMSVLYLKSAENNFAVSNKNYTVTSIYYIFCCWPFLFHIKNKAIKNAAFIFTGLLIVISFKRSTLLCLAFVLIVLFFLNFKKINVVKTMLYTLLYAGLIALFVYYYVKYTQKSADVLTDILNIWNKRLESGNIRASIYENVINLQIKSNIIEWVFGHGFDAVIKRTTSHFSAHCDYLEILFDYGIVSFYAFISFIVKLYKKAFAAKEISPATRNGLVCAVTTLVVASFPSHMLTYSTYYMILALYFGYASGIVDRENEVVSKGE